jgi:hypothetical protein
MTCEECEQILLDSRDYRRDYIRPKGWLAGIFVVDLAKAHAQDCPLCAAKVSDISKVNDILGQLRFSTMRIEAPARIEKHLVTEFRQSMMVRGPGATRTALRLVWGTVGALLALAAGFILYPAVRPRPPRAVQANRIPHKGPAQQLLSFSPDSTASQAEIGKQQPDGRPGLVISKKNVANAGSEPMQPHAARQSSLPTNEHVSLNGGGNVVRVTLPLSSLVAMGIPVHPEVSGGRVTADVTMDPFGAVVAVHLVEVKPIVN